MPPLKREHLLDAGVPASALPDCEQIFPALQVVPMGWSWAMWLSQRIHQHQAMVASGLCMERILVDGKPCPDLTTGEPVIVPYADNLNVLGIDKQRVQHTKDVIVRHLQKLGFIIHEELDAISYATSLGFTIDGVSGIVRPTPAKAADVMQALRGLEARPRVSGKAVERIIGHCVHFLWYVESYYRYFALSMISNPQHTLLARGSGAAQRLRLVRRRPC